MNQLSLSTRLIRYKIVKKDVEKFIEWKDKWEEDLQIAYRSYILQVDSLMIFNEYCLHVYNDSLPYVKKGTHRKYFK